MKIKEITVGASRTVNLGNYNSIKVEGSATVELNEESVSEARNVAIAEVKKQLDAAYKEFKPKK